MAEKKRREKIKLGGLFAAIKSLEEKLADLHKRQNEREEVRGFSLGGSSIKSTGQENDKDIAAQIAMIEAQIHEAEEQIENISNEVDEVVDGMENEVVNFKSLDGGNGGQAHDLEATADFYRGYGIECEVRILENGDGEINVKNPGNYQGKNILDMSKDQLEDMMDEIGEEEKDAQKTAEKENQKTVEKAGKSRVLVEDKDEDKNKDKEKKKPKEHSLLPGDIVEERGEQEKGEGRSLIFEKKKKPKKEDKKEKSDDKKPQAEEDVELPVYFDDSGLEEAGIKGVSKNRKIYR